MRLIVKDAKPPSHLESSICRKKALLALTEKQKHDYSGGDYAHPTKVRPVLIRLYFGKCGYCESKIETVATPHVEHYRPKKEVKEEPSHPGYYWLAYEWSNLILGCPKCNNKKSTHFPILGSRIVQHPVDSQGKLDRKLCVAEHPALIGEQPLLLHPELDDPLHHLFVREEGELSHRTKRGEKTIEICDLNRDTLKTSRKKLIDSFRNELSDVLTNFVLFKNSMKEGKQEEFLKVLFNPIFTRILEKTSPSEEYSLVVYFLEKDFDRLILEENHFLPQYASLISRAFKEFKSQNLSVD